jgi:hypothetical protein
MARSGLLGDYTRYVGHCLRMLSWLHKCRVGRRLGTCFFASPKTASEKSPLRTLSGWAARFLLGYEMACSGRQLCAPFGLDTPCLLDCFLTLRCAEELLQFLGGFFGTVFLKEVAAVETASPGPHPANTMFSGALARVGGLPGLCRAREASTAPEQ